MKVGVTLPTFRADAAAVESARRAEALGLDGVFVFDHLWPLGQPDRPALSAFVVLGAVAAATEVVGVGPLVARVGLVPDALVVAQLRSLALLAPGRLVAALGTGDSLSHPEGAAYGIVAEPASVRRRSLARVAAALQARGLPVWIGGGAPATLAVAHELGAPVNLWDATPDAVRAEAEHGEVTWGGPLRGDRAEIGARLAEIAAAGATWAVGAWPPSLDDVAAGAVAVR
jgi:alkanesulfonate monooxygenase SsuD/methylene tetrahydromethanopterin reductase-like flavin-dependent oxidoreductase (luciferase family)